MQLHCQLEIPAEPIVKHRRLNLSGWCFADDRRLSEVRVVANGVHLAGTYGIVRPDVLATYPAARDESTGFSVKGYPPLSSKQVHMEFRDTDGIWHRALSLPVIRSARTGFTLRQTDSNSERLLQRFPAHATHAARPVLADHLPHSLGSLKAPKIVVAVPSFQQGRYLRETLDSLHHGSKLRPACFIKDGGSTDDSRSILVQYASESVRWMSAPDDGQSAAIQTAFSELPGTDEDIMAWINSDDYYLPNALSFVSTYFARHPEIDVIYGHRILVDEESREIGRWFLPPHDDEVLRLQDFIPQETMFWRRRIWDKVGGIDTSFKFAMDWDLLLRFQAAGAKIVRVPYFLACFRIHSAQKTSAQMETVGQKEIDALRLRTFGRVLSPTEIENHPRLIRYLRKSAWIEFLWRRFGIRHP